MTNHQDCKQHDFFYYTQYDNQYRKCQNCGLEEYKRWEWVKA